MKLTALLLEIRLRARVLPAPDVDPLQAIHQRCAADPETLDNRSLMRITQAIEERRGDFDDKEIWNLSPEALGLLSALIERRISRG